MAKKMAFTPAAIDGLAAGALVDPLTPGLAVEILASGKKRWRYRRKIAGKKMVATLFGGLYPAKSIADARIWARDLNEQVEAGIDPRAAQREAKAVAQMTVGYAHSLYIAAAGDGRTSNKKRKPKPSTIKHKIGIYQRDIDPKLGRKNIHDVTEDDLIKLVELKGKTAKISANHLAIELRTFFGWASSLTGKEVGLLTNPASRLSQLRFPAPPRSRIFSTKELEWFLQALVSEPRYIQRGFLLCLLTAARISEVTQAESAEFSSGIWTIPAERVKNSRDHRIALGKWGQSLIQTTDKWVFQSETINGPRGIAIWYRARDRIKACMEEISGQSIKPFSPHDFRRTARSNTKRLDVDYETAEAMLNHMKQGLERVYDLYELEEEKRIWFLKWEDEIVSIAIRAGVAENLGAPIKPARNGYSFSMSLPKGTGVQPSLNLGTAKPGTATKFAQPSPKLIFAWETWRTPFPQPVDLTS